MQCTLTRLLAFSTDIGMHAENSRRQLVAGGGWRALLQCAGASSPCHAVLIRSVNMMSNQFASDELFLDNIDEGGLLPFDNASNGLPTDIFDPISLSWQSFEYGVDDTYCTCLDDLQVRFQTELEKNMSGTRVNRTALVCDLDPLAQLSLPSDGDSLLCVDFNQDSLQDSTIESYNVGDVVCGGDITLQQKACDMIVQAIAEVDQSAWVQANACAFGETVLFTYICSNSKEHWEHCSGPVKSASLVTCTSKLPNATGACMLFLESRFGATR